MVIYWFEIFSSGGLLLTFLGILFHALVIIRIRHFMWAGNCLGAYIIGLSAARAFHGFHLDIYFMNCTLLFCISLYYIVLHCTLRGLWYWSQRSNRVVQNKNRHTDHTTWIHYSLLLRLVPWKSISSLHGSGCPHALCQRDHLRQVRIKVKGFDLMANREFYNSLVWIGPVFHKNPYNIWPL